MSFILYHSLNDDECASHYVCLSLSLIPENVVLSYSENPGVPFCGREPDANLSERELELESMSSCSFLRCKVLGIVTH